MATPAQTLTNKQIAQHSTGPRTAEGKQRFYLNALRHGLTGQVVLLPGEEAEAYAAFRETVFHDFAPVGSLELILVQTVTDTQLASRTRPQPRSRSGNARPTRRNSSRNCRHRQSR